MGEQADRSAARSGKKDTASGSADGEPPREVRRQVVIDVLATAIVDLLLNERVRVRGEHEA